MAGESHKWEVIDQRPTTVDAGSKYEPAMIVYFRTRHGVRSSITVDRKDYEPERVRHLLDKAATAIDEVSELKSS